MTSSGAMAGMLTGAIIVFGWKEILPENSALASIYEMIPAFSLATIAVIVVSLLSPKPEQHILDTFEQADKAYKNAL